jgi:hypothetical protein
MRPGHFCQSRSSIQGCLWRVSKNPNFFYNNRMVFRRKAKKIGPTSAGMYRDGSELHSPFSFDRDGKGPKLP